MENLRHAAMPGAMGRHVDRFHEYQPAERRGTVAGRRIAIAVLTALTLLCAAPLRGGNMARRQTEVSIHGDAFYLNGRPTYAGRTWRGHKIEGLLLNSRMVQAIFDDLNPKTRGRWAYPDTGEWDPERNVREFMAAMPAWREHGLLAFTVNLQGGNPGRPYSSDPQPWHNSAWTEDGQLRPDYANRLRRLLDRADELGMVVIVGLFYFGQDGRLRDEAAVRGACDRAARWLLREGYTNVLVEINNECDTGYSHEILKPEHVHELIAQVKAVSHEGRRLLVGTSYGGGTLPGESVLAVSDFVLLHGNFVEDPKRIAELVRETRALPSYRPMPVLFNEDDHYGFGEPMNNLVAAVSEHASWGYLDKGVSDYQDGYQRPPVNWGINTERKKAFFGLVREITGM